MKKQITIPTNLNGKLNCDAMVHISAAPATGIPESAIDQAVIEIITADNTFPASCWKLVDLCRLAMGELHNIYTFPSHGMDFYDFYHHYKSVYPATDASSPMAVYFYLKIKENADN